MKIEPRRTINWDEYIHTITLHKPNIIKGSRNQHSNRKIRLMKESSSIKTPRDLSSTIDHSVMLYNQIMSSQTQTSCDISQIKQNTPANNTTTSLSTSAYPIINPKVFNCKQLIYQTSINVTKPISRNTLSSFHTHNFRAESLEQFKDKIRQERIGKILNKVSMDTLMEHYYTNDNNNEALDTEIANRVNTKKYLDCFSGNYKAYYEHIIREVYNESYTNSSLKQRVNDLKTEIDRLKHRKQKLLQTFETYYQMKLFLMRVKNRTLNSEEFSYECLNAHRKDKERHLLVKNDYRKVNTINIRKTRGVGKASKESVIRLDKEMIEYFPQKNEEIFTNLHDFMFIFEDSNNYLAKLLTELNNSRESCNILKSELKAIKNEDIHSDHEIEAFDKIINHKEHKLIEVKERNKELMKIISKLPKTAYYEPYKQTKENITKFYKQLNNLSSLTPNPKLQTSHTTVSLCLIYLEDIELALNALIVKNRNYLIKYKDSYIKLKIDRAIKNKAMQYEQAKKRQEERALLNIQKVFERKNKILFLPKRKGAPNYPSIQSTSLNSSRLNRNQFHAVTTLFNES